MQVVLKGTGLAWARAPWTTHGAFGDRDSASQVLRSADSPDPGVLDRTKQHVVFS